MILYIFYKNNFSFLFFLSLFILLNWRYNVVK